ERVRPPRREEVDDVRHPGQVRRRPLRETSRMSTKVVLTPDDEAEVEAFAGSLFMAGLAALELANIELGVRLGLYEALAGAGAVTSGGRAHGCAIAERYAREWLEQQAVAGVLDVEDVTAGPTERRFTLSN